VEAVALARLLGRGEAVLLPPVWYSFNEHHLDFPGTIAVGGQTIIDYVTDIGVSLAHHGFRKILFRYADMRKAWERSLETPTGAGLSFLGLCLVIAALSLGLLGYARAQDVRVYIPENAKPLLPQLRKVQLEFWPEHRFPSYFGALIEQESCITLRHPRCWNSRAQLKTDREEGAGLGQFTRAWAADGSLRFDAIAEVRQLDPVGLSGFSWQTVYARADLSMRAILVKVRDCDRRLAEQTMAGPATLLAFCDAAYNGGFGGLLQDRRICAATAGCDPNVWFDNVERTSAKSRERATSRTAGSRPAVGSRPTIPKMLPGRGDRDAVRRTSVLSSCGRAKNPSRRTALASHQFRIASRTSC